MPRLLLLTGTAPRPDGVGGIILHDLLTQVPPDSIRVAHVVETMGKSIGNAVDGQLKARSVTVNYRRAPVSRWGKIGRLLQWPSLLFSNNRNIRRAVEECVAFARSERIEEVWAVLDSPLTIEMAATIAEALAVPLRVTVWDDVEHNTRYFKLGRFTAARNRTNFARAIERAAGLAVIGETMRSEYQRRYGRSGVVLRHGAARAQRTVSCQEASGDIRIGFAGSVSARSAFNIMLASLDRLQWQIAGRPVTLVLMGGRFDLWSNVPRRIEVLGWRSVDETIDILSQCAVTYLPQPFEDDWRPFAEWSFPSKLTTYLAAGAPVLLHAPSYASLPGYFTNRPFGELCTALDEAQLADALVRLVEDQSLRGQVVECAERALEDDFSAKRFHSDFCEFLDIDPQVLAA